MLLLCESNLNHSSLDPINVTTAGPVKKGTVESVDDEEGVNCDEKVSELSYKHCKPQEHPLQLLNHYLAHKLTSVKRVT